MSIMESAVGSICEGHGGAGQGGAKGQYKRDAACHNICLP